MVWLVIKLVFMACHAVGCRTKDICGLLGEHGGLKGSVGSPLPCAWDDFRSLDQAEPGDHSSLVRSTSSLDEAPLVLVLFDHTKGLPQPDGQLVAQGWSVKRGHGYQLGTVTGINALAQVCAASSVNQEVGIQFFLHPLTYSKGYENSMTGSLNWG